MVHLQWSEGATYHRLLSTYVNQTTTHGVRKISSSRHPARRCFWIVVFLSSLSGCCYHCSYLIGNYLSNPKVTITQEKDADFVEFPALTVCNLNVIKKDYAHQYFEMSSRKLKASLKKANSTTKAPNMCYQSEEELIQKSAVDLSDTWLSLGVTKDNLSLYGHKAEDLIIQCTFNSKDCFGNNTTFYVKITNVTSPIFGLCHTLSVKKNDTDEAMTIKKGGTQQGIRLTLNIERADYWDLISAEYGVRLLVHPQGTFPTLQRGGIIASPGRSVHIGVKRRLTKLLPGYEGSCTETFLESPIRKKLKTLNLDFDLESLKYTYEHCNTLCQNTLLFSTCACLDEQPTGSSMAKWKFCNPCNKTEVQESLQEVQKTTLLERSINYVPLIQLLSGGTNQYRKEAKCRGEVLRNFTDSGNDCDDICKPSCRSIRYDISLSKADWPNLNHQQFVMNRSFEQWTRIPEALGLLDSLEYEGGNITDIVNDTFFSENLLRVHVFIEEMIYMSIEETYSYTLPKLMADLGGCLGLYLGVSVISIIEFIDLFGSASLLCLLGSRESRFSERRTGSRRRRRRNRTADENGPQIGFFRRRPQTNKNIFRNVDHAWRNSGFSSKDIYYQNDATSRIQGMRWS